jgi:kumamolisin
MRRSLILLSLAAILLLTVTAFAQAPAVQVPGGKIVTPSSTTGLPGLKVRTPLHIFIPDSSIMPDAGSPPSNAETPGSLACIYGVTAPTNGCPRSGAPVPTGGSKAIAVVDYGHNSTLQSDFNTFSAFYGLPAQTLQFICDCGSCPSNNGTGWDVETALDTQYAHAMAPNAQIIVAEFCNDPFDGGQNAAEYKAGTAVAAAGGGEVSNSFGYNGGEDSSELDWDQWMNVSGVVYFTSAGDDGLGPAYPSVSPRTVSVGGTKISRDSNGLWTGTEVCWQGSGGGISQYEPLPQYQLILGNKLGPHRGTPDWSADAGTPAAVYSTTGCNGWCGVIGTSLSSPLLAGIVNAAGNFKQSTARELAPTYQYYLNPGRYRHYFYDVTQGSNGAQAVVGWDQCTGLGTPRDPSGL